MKKLFYIVLVIVALMVISRFVKEKSNRRDNHCRYGRNLRTRYRHSAGY